MTLKQQKPKKKLFGNALAREYGKERAELLMEAFIDETYKCMRKARYV